MKIKIDFNGKYYTVHRLKDVYKNILAKDVEIWEYLTLCDTHEEAKEIVEELLKFPEYYENS